ncbi:hypothetical protein Ancab_026162, partial [Ancistrocladus abbreviatus]
MECESEMCIYQAQLKKSSSHLLARPEQAVGCRSASWLSTVLVSASGTQLSVP